MYSQRDTRSSPGSKSDTAQSLSYSKSATKGFDPVTSPEHYTVGEVECVDVMTEMFGEDTVRDGAVVQAFQYLFRWKKKGESEEQLRKALWWLLRALGHDPRAVFKYLEGDRA